MNKQIVSFLGAIFLFAISQSLFAQEPNGETKTIMTSDSAKITFEEKESPAIINPIRERNPKIASWLSAAVPGAGQVYNGKAWKVPIIYGAFATTLYLTMDYNNRYEQYKEIYKRLSEEEEVNGGSGTDAGVNANELERAKEGMKYYTRYRDINIIFTLLFYILNIVDASVDAHLSNFDVGDNLAHQWQPALFNSREQFAVGIKYTLRF